MEADQYLQMILSIFIVIVLVLVFIFYTQGSRNNNRGPVILGPGGQQWWIQPQPQQFIII